MREPIFMRNLPSRPQPLWLYLRNSDHARRRPGGNDSGVAIATNDRLRAFVDLLLDNLDDRATGDELAARAYLSRYHFDRLVASALGESPGAFRRRLLLERAAWQLQHGASVLEVALAAGYRSSEAFSRAFARAFAVPPSRHRNGFRLPAANGIHFHPPGGLLVPAGTERREEMDLTDRMLEHDLWLTRQLLDAAGGLPEEQLDRPIAVTPEVTHDFPADPPTTRDMLERLIYSKEIWTAAIAGREAPPDDRGRSLPELRGRFERSSEEFAAIVRDIRERCAWDTAFVDAICDPPE